MKRIYWRPPAAGRRALVLVAVVSLVLLALVESLQLERRQPWYEEKVAAARLAQQAAAAIKAEKLRRGLRVDPETDPTESGLIGEALTPVTANTGYLAAKQLSVDPDWAAVLVHYFRRANVERGDLVAVGASGSFPALNVATLAALQVIGAEPVIIASASASEWGANHVEYVWLDMERTLADSGILRARSVAASLGGIDDRGYGLTKEGRNMLRAAIARAGLTPIEATSLSDSIDRRMRIFDERAAGRPYKAYVNVGGGAASVGTHVGKKQFRPGLNLGVPRDAGLVDSMMLRFARRDVPVVHLTNLEDLARQWGIDPSAHARDGGVGHGLVYARREYNRWLAGGALAVLLAVMLVFLRLDVGHRVLQQGVDTKGAAQPEPMV